QLERAEMVKNLLGHHRAHFLEHLAAFLAEQLVARADTGFVTTIEEAEVVADIAGKLRLQTRTENAPRRCRHGILLALQYHGGGHVTKDEMAIAIGPAQVARGDFRVYHHHAFRA